MPFSWDNSIAPGTVVTLAALNETRSKIDIVDDILPTCTGNNVGVNSSYESGQNVPNYMGVQSGHNHGI